MATIEAAAKDFLACRRIAVTGVSRNPEGHGSNAVYGRLKERGYDVIAVNPNATEIDGDPAYPDLKSIPGGVEAVVIGTRPERAQQTVAEAADLGIDKVWMHRSFGAGSVSVEAARFGRDKGITVIDGGCPPDVRPGGRRRPQVHVPPHEDDRQGAAHRLSGGRSRRGGAGPAASPRINRGPARLRNGVG